MKDLKLKNGVVIKDNDQYIMTNNLFYTPIICIYHSSAKQFISISIFKFQ